jgi:hypothetical protein
MLAAGCNIHDTGSPSVAKENTVMTGQAQDIPPPFPEEGKANYYVVGIGREIRVNEKLTIRFVRVNEDSRCPEGVTCVWSGRASLETLVITEGTQKSVVFKVMGINRWPPTGEIKSGTVKTLDVDGNKITLMDLAPYPVYQRSIDSGHYRALFYLGPNPPSFDTGPPAPALTDPQS